MEIVRGVQPNCSELVIYLSDRDIDDVRHQLDTIGFNEALIGDFYNFSDKPEQDDWDNDSNRERITLLKDMPADVRRLVTKFKEDKITTNEINKLKKLGYDLTNSSVHLIKGTADFDHASTLNLYRDFEDGPAIVGHQHCQKQLFPLLKEISDLFGEEVQGYDGGSDSLYYEWVEAGCPDINNWTPEGEEENG